MNLNSNYNFLHNKDNLCVMNDENNILEIDNLNVYFHTDYGILKSVNGISLDIPKGKVVALVGESGCGKSVTSLSIMRLLSDQNHKMIRGQIRYNTSNGAVDLLKMPLSSLQNIRGNEISMIFQDPMTSLNPIFTIGDQIEENIKVHNKILSKRLLYNKTIELLNSVGISRPKEIYRSYPHQLSGGMRQRIIIAMAISCKPKLIIADEPTTALDVTIQAQILDLLRELNKKYNISILLITHDLGVVAEIADYVIVMYAGKILEKSEVNDLYSNPKHPYTIGLLKSNPSISKFVGRLYSIPGNLPNPYMTLSTCYFKDRCNMRIEKCNSRYPDTIDVGISHKVACHLYSKCKW